MLAIQNSMTESGSLAQDMIIRSFDDELEDEMAFNRKRDRSFQQRPVFLERSQ
jgi:hypothetical protein